MKGCLRIYYQPRISITIFYSRIMQNPKCKRVVVVVKRLALLTHFFGAVVQHFCKTTAVQISMFGAHFSKKGVPTGALMKQFK